MTLTAAPLALRKLVEADLGVVERGLGLVDHHFSLGASAVGVMALDATGSLTLIAVDLNADDELFRGAAGARTAGVADIRTSSSASSQARGSGPISRRDCSSASSRAPSLRLLPADQHLHLGILGRLPFDVDDPHASVLGL